MINLTTVYEQCILGIWQVCTPHEQMKAIKYGFTIRTSRQLA